MLPRGLSKEKLQLSILKFVIKQKYRRRDFVFGVTLHEMNGNTFFSSHQTASDDVLVL